MAGHLLPAGGVFAFLDAHRGELFPDGLFADMFTTQRGRPSIPAEVIASVIVLQTLNGLSDEAAAEAVTFDLRWKAACGLAVTAKGFHPTTLTYWRRRLANSDRPNRIFDVVKDVVAATGVLTGKTRRALDSTVLDDAVATQDTVTQLIAAIRRVAREVPAAAGMIAAHCIAHDYTDPGKPRIAWDDAGAREQLVDALVTDAHRLLGHLPKDELGPKAAEAVALLALVAGQDVKPVEDSDGTDGRWRIARRVAPDRVISTVDPETRHAHKTRSRRKDGYKAHVVVEPDTGLITDTALTPAAGPHNSDAAVVIDLLAQTDQQLEVLADSAYGTGDALAALADAEHTPIIKPWPLRPAVAGGFTLDDFTVIEPTDDQPGSVTCPNGITRPITPHPDSDLRRACRGCPFLARCTTSASRTHTTAPARRAATRAPGPRAGPRLPGCLPPAPADGRTLDRLAGRRREPPAAVPRDHSSTICGCTTASPAQPAPTAQPRPHPHRGRMGDGLNSHQTPPLTGPARVFHPRQRRAGELVVAPSGADSSAAQTAP